MIILLSPAKSLNFEESVPRGTQNPVFKKETSELIQILKKYQSPDISQLMGVSQKIADLNYKRYQEFGTRYTDKNSRASMFAFDGDVYKGMDTDQLSEEDIAYAQEHVRILSGLYGIISPMDKMQAYRLEMGTKLQNDHGKNLYEFWGEKITKQINKDLKSHQSDLIVNLASNEYFKSVKTKLLKGTLIDCAFKEYRDGQLKFISFNAKKARGFMTRYIVKNRIEDKEGLKGFNYENYSYNEEGSTEKELLFVR